MTSPLILSNNVVKKAIYLPFGDEFQFIYQPHVTWPHSDELGEYEDPMAG